MFKKEDYFYIKKLIEFPTTMSSSQKTTTQTKSTRKVKVTKTITKTGPDVSMQNLEYVISAYY